MNNKKADCRLRLTPGTNASKLIKVIYSHDRFTPMLCCYVVMLLLLCYVLVRHFITSQVFKERERYKTYNYKTDIKKT